jgi:phage tail sheath protein FI
MSVNPRTPGVYIDEIPLLPASVTGIDTAVPAFIGYVQKAESNGAGIQYNTPVRITSIFEYETIFGKADPQQFSTVEINDSNSVTPPSRTVTVVKAPDSIFRMYYNIQMYFINGGGVCYIVPVGLYGASPAISKNDLLAGLDAVAKVDDATMLVFPDAVSLTDPTDRQTVHDAALAQCADLKDRFVIMDVIHIGGNTVNDDADDFRNADVGPDNLKYGAAYYPNLNTTLGYSLNESLIHVTSQKVNGSDAFPNTNNTIALLNTIEVALYTIQNGYANFKMQLPDLSDLFITAYRDLIKAAVNDAFLALSAVPSPPTAIISAVSTDLTAAKDTTANALPGTFYTINTDYNTTQSQANADAVSQAFKSLINALTTIQFNAYAALSTLSGWAIGSLAFIKNTNPSLYSTISAQLASYNVQLSACGTMAGIYSSVDAERGVWKAPANVGINSILGPSINITNSEQDGLNIDSTGGKSINVIRSFTGRGTLVWGARTLAGNDNEWRYVNVRRLFIYVEKSVKNATEFIVFEPNTANTWQTVRSIIETFLTGLWRQGALSGSTSKEAFFVNVGLGTTMTADDILNGRMIIEIGLAAVRPAEFIIIKFELKLQES